MEATLNELNEIMTYMNDILHYPLPNENCVVDDQLQQDILLIMEKSLHQLIEKLGASRYFYTKSILGKTINKSLECIYLITGNKVFIKCQIDKILFFVELLKYNVYIMSRNFITNNNI